jgi:hypothetical protein
MAFQKKIQVISSLLLAALVMVSSFGYTLVVHSCSMSGQHTIFINKTNPAKACTDCCSNTQEASKSTIKEDCCKDQYFSHVLLIEASTIESISAARLIPAKLFVPLHFLHSIQQPFIVFFGHAPQNARLLAISRPTSLSYRQQACKLQI